MWIVGKYLVLTHNMLSTAKVSKSQVDQGELLVQQSKAYNIYSTAAQLTLQNLQNCQMFYNFLLAFSLSLDDIKHAKDQSKPMMTMMAWCEAGHTSSLIDHGAVWDLLPWGAIQEFFGMAMKRIQVIMMVMMKILMTLKMLKVEWKWWQEKRAAVRIDKVIDRQFLTGAALPTIPPTVSTISRYVTISHPVFTISQPPGVPPDFFVGYFSVHGLVQVSRFLKGYSQPFFLVSSTTTTKHTDPTVV